MRSITECLGDNVKRLRLERGFTQEAFARHAKLSISFLQNIEKGKKWAAPGTIRLLAKALRVPEDELFRDCERRPSPDPKDVLLAFCKAFGIVITETEVASLPVKRPPFELYERMPDEIAIELADLCRAKDWDWAAFRLRMRG